LQEWKDVEGCRSGRMLKVVDVSPLNRTHTQAGFRYDLDELKCHIFEINVVEARC